MNTIYRPNSVRWIGSRSGPTFCQPWSGFKIVCKVLESFKVCSRSENTQHTTFSVVIYNIFLSPSNIWFWYISHFQATKAGTNSQNRQTTTMYGCRWRLTKIFLGFVKRPCRKNIHGWFLLSVDNLCKQFGSSSGPTKYHTVWQPGGKLILKEFFNTFNNFEETNRQTTKKNEKLPSMQRVKSAA